MQHIRVLLIVGLMVLLAAGCSGEGARIGDPDGNASDRAGATESTRAIAGEKEVTISTDPAAGGRVETCGGDDIYLNATEKKLLGLHNEARKERGLKPFCVHPTLTEAARAHSEDMIEQDYFAHATPSGESLGERLRRFGYTAKGYSYWKVGGNIAWHSGPRPEPENMFNGWMNSPHHRVNILSEDFRQIGLGTYAGAYKSYEESVMYTAEFGVRRG